MRLLVRERALDVISEENCQRVIDGIYICGLDYLLVKRWVLGEIAGDVFGFVGDYVPVLNVSCDAYVMYYGIPKVMYSDRFMIQGWKMVESGSSIVVYSCVDDMDFYEAEEFIFLKVPISMFGFGSAEMYSELIDLLRKKTLYMVRFLY